MLNEAGTDGSRPWETVRMTPHVVFLRAINLGRRRRVPMAELVECLSLAGCTDVATHLATGNVRVAGAGASRTDVEDTVERACRERFGFEVPAFAFTVDDVNRIVSVAEALDVPTSTHRYVTLLKRPVAAETRQELDDWSAPGEGARAGEREVHWWSEHGTQGSRLGNELLERRLGPATTRTLRVVATVAQKWCA